MKKILLIIFLIMVIFQMVVLATTITIGLPAIGRDSSASGTYTWLNIGAEANGTGKITTVEVWALVTIENAKVGIFYLVSGTNYTCRDYETIGTVTGGAKRTFTVDLDVEVGDLIGIYAGSGSTERTTSGQPGLYYLSGDQMGCVDTTFTLFSNHGISLYGIGATAEVGIKWNGVTITKWNGITITKINGK